MPARLRFAVLACSTLGISCAPGTTPTVPAVAVPPGLGTTSLPRSAVRATSAGMEEVSGAYRQGVARVPDGWVFSTNWALYRTDEGLVEQVKNEAAIPDDWKAKGYNHIGDIDVVDGVVYAPVEQPNYDDGRQAMFRFDATTLRFLDGVEIASHENSFVTVDTATKVAYSMDRFGGEAITRYDVQAGWKALAPLPLTTFVDKVQGADIADGALWLASDDASKGLYRVDQTTGTVTTIGSVGWLDGETEGIDATSLPSGQLHVLSIDAKFFPVRFVHFATERHGR